MADNLELLFGKLGNEQTRKFIHGVINLLCQKDGIHFDQFSDKLSLSEFSSLKRSLSDVVRKLGRGGTERKELTESANKLGLSQEVGGVIVECVWVRRDEIRGRLIEDSASLSNCSLRDYDLKTKLVLASDKLGSVQEPLVTLDLTLEEGGKERRENLELSQDELAKLVSALDAANKVVLQLRT